MNPIKYYSSNFNHHLKRDFGKPLDKAYKKFTELCSNNKLKNTLIYSTIIDINKNKEIKIDEFKID